MLTLLQNHANAEDMPKKNFLKKTGVLFVSLVVQSVYLVVFPMEAYAENGKTDCVLLSYLERACSGEQVRSSVKGVPAAGSIFKGSTWQVDMLVQANGGAVDRTFLDGDSISLSLLVHDKDLEIDSIVWKAWLTNVRGGRESFDVSRDSSFSILVAPRLFGRSFGKAASARFGLEGAIGIEGGDLLNPDFCRFTCSVYAHKYGDPEYASVVSGSYSFDVLPKCPVLRELATWTEPGDDEWPITRLRIDTERYEYVSIYVIQENPNRFETFQDTVFSKDFGLEYIIEPGGWGNSIYCYVYNEYGVYKSATLKISKPTEVGRLDAECDGCRLEVKGHNVHIDNKTPFVACIYDLKGCLLYCSDKVRTAHIALPKGIYVVRVKDEWNHVLSTRKISLK